MTRLHLSTPALCHHPGYPGCTGQRSLDWKTMANTLATVIRQHFSCLKSSNHCHSGPRIQPPSQQRLLHLAMRQWRGLTIFDSGRIDFWGWVKSACTPVTSKQLGCLDGDPPKNAIDLYRYWSTICSPCESIASSPAATCKQVTLGIRQLLCAPVENQLAITGYFGYLKHCHPYWETWAFRFQTMKFGGVLQISDEPLCPPNFLVSDSRRIRGKPRGLMIPENVRSTSSNHRVS